ncbi:MAG: PAP/fibrillin family protein [Cyanobacteria bacterium P01_A01_bin.37]
MTTSAKIALLEAIAGQNRGMLSTLDEQQIILDAVGRLEPENPTPNPLQSAEKLNGDWRLLYTTSDELLRIDRLPLYSLGQIYQCVRVSDARIYNIAEVTGTFPLNGLVSVAARYEPVSDCRVNVSFERAIFGLQSLLRYQSPSSFVNQIEAGESFRAIDFKITNREQRGWLDITYLDDDCRIGRGNQGSVFVLTKMTPAS